MVFTSPKAASSPSVGASSPSIRAKGRQASAAQMAGSVPAASVGIPGLARAMPNIAAAGSIMPTAIRSPVQYTSLPRPTMATPPTRATVSYTHLDGS